MKKIFLYTLVTTLFIFSGCVFFQKQGAIPVVNQGEIELEKKIGIVTSPIEEGMLNALAPWLLVTDTAEKIFVDSLSIHLKRYKKRRIEAEGKWNDAKTVFFIEQVTSLTQDTQTKTTYRSPPLGISFQYPSLWELKEAVNTITITPYEVLPKERSDTFIIERRENPKKLSPREWLSLDEKYQPFLPGLDDKNYAYQKNSIGIGLYDAVKKTSLDGKIEFFISRDTFLYHVSHDSIGDSDRDLYQNAFFDLIASFEFIPFGPPLPSSKPVTLKKSLSAGSTAAQEMSLQDRAQKLIQEKQAKQEKSDQEEALKKKQAALKEIRKTFLTYIKEHIFDFISEPSQQTVGVTIEELEFALREDQESFSGIYVIYQHGQELKRILLKVPDETKPQNMVRVASFRRGKMADWDLIEGTDIEKNSDRAIMKATGDVLSVNIVKKGLKLIEAKSFKIKIQYPASWYWVYVSNGYSFSTKPVTASNVFIRLTKNSDTPSQIKEIPEINGKRAFESLSNNILTLCLEAKALYCLTGNLSYRQIMMQMIQTLEE